MAKDFSGTAKSIVDAIGGIDNIKNLTHCMTRLRFILIDESKANDELVKSIPGVIGLVKQSGQYQVIIGNNVASVYNEIMKLGLPDNTPPTQDKGKLTLKKSWNQYS